MFPVSPRNASTCIAELNLVNQTEWGLLQNNTFAEIEGYDCYPTRFQSTKEAEGAEGQFFWHVLFARLAYFIVFEHVCFLIKFFVLRMIQKTPEVVKQMERVEEHIYDSLLIKYQPSHPEHDIQELVEDVGTADGGADAESSDNGSGGAGGSGWGKLRKRAVAPKPSKALLLWPSVEELQEACNDGEAAQRYFQKLQINTSIV